MNIEDTRHNEVQLLGNGQWCIELGGRDCSLQMHEQKLVELSLTEELLERTIAEYLESGKIVKKYFSKTLLYSVSVSKPRTSD